MKAHVERDWMSRTVKVWLWRQGERDTRQVLRFLGGDTYQWDEVLAAVVMEPSFVLQEDAFAALVAAGSDILPPSAATSQHLADAIGVRDRLLTLVESAAASQYRAEDHGDDANA